jgi:hypothetical protein
MSSKIVVLQHELVDRVINALDDEGWHKLSQEVLDAIAAPVVERQPNPEPEAFMYQHEETGVIGFVDLQQVEWGFEKNNPRLHLICPLFRAPPELAELQAPTNGALIKDLTEVIAQQAAEIERLKGGQGEPVLQAREITGEPATWEDMDDFTFSVCRTDSHMYETRILYRQPVSQPAPVAVLGLDVFKALEKVRGAPVLTTNQCYDLARELNACLDKVKELNQ